MLEVGDELYVIHLTEICPSNTKSIHLLPQTTLQFPFSSRFFFFLRKASGIRSYKSLGWPLLLLTYR